MEEKEKVAGAKVDEDEAKGYFTDDKKHLVVVLTVRCRIAETRSGARPQRPAPCPRACRRTRASAAP